MDIPKIQHESVEDKISELFKDYRSRYSDTDLMLMTALADGGDRMAARAAIKVGMKILPVFPYDEKIYRKSFGNRGDTTSNVISNGEFDDILNDDRVYSPYTLSHIDPSAVQGGFGKAYRALAAYMIANSDILIALWDGREYEGKSVAGGTYDTVRMAYRGIDHEVRHMVQPMPESENTGGSSPSRHLDVTEDCLIYHIRTDREISDDDLKKKGAKEPEYPMPFGTVGYLVPEMVSDKSGTFETENTIKRLEKEKMIGSERKEHHVLIDRKKVELHDVMPIYYRNIFSRINEMNQDIEALERKKTQSSNIERKKLSEEKRAYSGMFGECGAELEKEGVLKEMLLRTAAADELARIYQSSSFRSIKVSIALSVITALFLQLYILFGADSVVIFFYFISLFSATVLFWRHKKSRRYQKFIEYRMLAESMRVCCYWSVLGINESVTASCYGYMKNDTMWARCVLTAWESYFLNDYLKSDSLSDETRRKIGLVWIDGQKDYHGMKKMKNSSKMVIAGKIGRYLRISSILLSLGILLLVAASLGQTILKFVGKISIGDVLIMSSLAITQLVILQIVIIGLSIATLILTGVDDKLIHGGTGRQIEAKYRMFNIAGRRLQIMEDEAEPEEIDGIRQGVYYELGVQCINEVNDWAFEHILKDMSAPS